MGKFNNWFRWNKVDKMVEAIFGLLGVFIGSGISWFQTHVNNKKVTAKKARYLAIRVVITLDKFVENCGDVLRDDGLSFGQRTSEGSLQPQVKAPGPPVFPMDVDWTSIDQEMMFKLLSLPSEVEWADEMIKATSKFAGPPDFEEWFDERIYHYSKLGLVAYSLSQTLCNEYGIQKKIYNDWDPVESLRAAYTRAETNRQQRLTNYRDFVNRIKPE